MTSYYQKNRKHLLVYKHEYYRANKEKWKLTPFARWVKNIKQFYGMSLEHYRQLEKQQQKCCAICKSKPKTRLFVDHCHKSKVIRGLLCSNCNFGLGLFKDSPWLLILAAEYLRRHNEQ